MSKKFKLSHQPLPSQPKASYKEELEMARDLVLGDILLYTPTEIAEMIGSGLIKKSDVEDLCAPSVS